MFLKKLSITGFKNIESAELAFGPGFSCFTGTNGAGKTNILDAVHYLSLGRSSLTMTDGQCVGHGRDFFLLDGEYESPQGRNERIVCGFKKGAGKTLKFNGKEYERLSDHVGAVPVVTVSPADSFLVTDSAEERRRFMDSFLSQIDKSYLSSIIRYRQILAERNRLLKEFTIAADMMEVLDMQLDQYGSEVYNRRLQLIGLIQPLVTEFYRHLSDDREQVEILYDSDLSEGTLSELLRMSAARDKTSGFTNCGIHRDELKMSIGGMPLRKYGSQGQQKSFLIALKLAQHRIVAQKSGKRPLLLLDDIFDKLDADRVLRLIRLVSEGDFGQIFITDHSRDRLCRVLEQVSSAFAVFTVDSGRITGGER